MLTNLAQDGHSNFETNLRDRLIAAQTVPGHPGADSVQHSGATGPYPPDPRHSSGSDNQIDPLIGISESAHHSSDPDYDMGGLGGDGMSPMSNSKAAGRRELSTTKRAAQNRAAQRAFRQRKEAYITKMEKQVQDYRNMEEDFKALQSENYQLREYILSLQTRILESSSELPPPPSRVQLGGAIDVSRSQQLSEDQGLAIDPSVRSNGNTSHAPAPTASMTAANATRASEEGGMPQAAVEQLQAAAAEAGGLGNGTSKGDD